MSNPPVRPQQQPQKQANPNQADKFVWQPGDIVTDECPNCGHNGAPRMVMGAKVCPKCATRMRPLGESSK